MREVNHVHRPKMSIVIFSADKDSECEIVGAIVSLLWFHNNETLVQSLAIVSCDVCPRLGQ